MPRVVGSGGNRTNLRLVVAAFTIVAAGLLVATVVGAPGLLSPAGTEYEVSVDMTVVKGKVWYMGSTVVGASVNVSMYDGDTLRSYYKDVTDSLGEYIATFGGFSGLPWAVGDTILVKAEKDAVEASNSTVASDEPFHYVNVTLGTEIPEFGDLGAIAPVAGVLGMFMAFFFARKRKNA